MITRPTFKTRCLWCLVLILITGCQSHQDQPGNKGSFNYSISTDTLFQFINCYLRSSIAINGESFLVVEDNITNYNILYSMESNSITDTLSINSYNVQRRLINSSLFPYLEWLNRDSLAFEDLAVPPDSPYVFKIYSLSQDSIVFKISNFNDTSLGLQNTLFAFYSYSPPQLVFPDKIYGHVIKVDEPLDDYHYAHTMGALDLKSRKPIVFNVQFPYDETKGDYAFIKEYYVTYNDSCAILSTSLSNDVVVFNLNTLDSFTVRVKSKFHKPVNPPSTLANSDRLDMDVVEESQIKAFYYLPIYYDSYRNIYYRGFKKSLNLQLENGMYATLDDKKTGVMVLDENFNVLGEVEIEELSKSAYQYGSCITRKGLTMLSRHKDSINVLNTFCYER